MEVKMLFVAVEFPNDPNVVGRVFWYGCRDESVCVDDGVYAPLGRHNRLQLGVVRKTLWATEEGAPFPMHEIKYVKQKVSTVGE